MSESVITSSIITIACVVCATMLISVLYPAMDRASSSVTTTAEAMGDQIKTDIEIIEEAKVTTGHKIGVKNIGSSTIDKIDTGTDVFFGKTGDFTRMAFDNSANPSGLSWTYDHQIGRWDPKETLEINITDDITIGTDEYYYVKISLYNGESAEDVFSF